MADIAEERRYYWDIIHDGVTDIVLASPSAANTLAYIRGPAKVRLSDYHPKVGDVRPPHLHFPDVLVIKGSRADCSDG